MRRLLPALGAALLLALGSHARAEETRYVLAPTLFQTDPAPYAFQQVTGADGRPEPGPDLQALNRAFAQRFEQVFPGRNRPLNENDMLDPNERTMVVVPRLSVVRLNQNTRAGVLDEFEAVVVGDVTLMDPWTMTRLFAATRMTTGLVGISRDKSEPERQARIREALDTATRDWMTACLAEIQRSAHPFVLKAGILPTRSGAKLKGGGGFWPFGRLEGVKQGLLVRTATGRQAKVREVFEHFSVVANVAKPSMTLDEGEEYQVVLVDSDAQTDRAEPRVAIRWIGPEPVAPGPDMQLPPTGAGWSGLMANYLSKSGGLRLLPNEEGDDREAWTALAAYLKNFSKKTQSEGEDQDIKAIRAKEAPDLLVEIGLVDAYHGFAYGPDGAVDHRFNLNWGVRWADRQGEGPTPPVFRGVQFQAEDRVLRTKAGIRELDLSSQWFNLCRNGIIKLAKTLEAGLRPRTSQVRGLAKGSGQVAWPGPAPAPGTRLQWRRFLGNVQTRDGRVLGGYFGKAEPITLARLDRCDPGDELSYTAGEAGTLVGVLPPVLGPGVTLQPEWAQAALAARIAKVCKVDLVLLADPAAAAPEGANGGLLRLQVDTPQGQAQGPAMKVGAAWRLRVYNGEYSPSTEPAFKIGLGHSGLYPIGAPYQPGDLCDASLAEQNAALDELVRRSLTQGLSKALLKE